MGSTRLRLVDTPLIRFTSAVVLPLGMIDLLLYLGETPNWATHMSMFMVID